MATKGDRNIPPGIDRPARRTIVNQATGETVTFEKYGCETHGEFTQAQLTCKPGGGPPLHYHNSYAERFRAVEGELGVALGDDPPTHLQPGEEADIPVGVKHRFFNDGDKDVTFAGYVLPAHPGFEKSLYVLFGLANDGFIDAQTGMPKSLVHASVIAELGDMSFPGLMGSVMKRVSKILAQWARWRGIEEELLKKYWD